MKANSDARKIQKEQRIEDKRIKAEEAAREQDERDKDLMAWSNKIRTQHDVRVHQLSYPCANLNYTGNYAKDAGSKAAKSRATG